MAELDGNIAGIREEHIEETPSALCGDVFCLKQQGETNDLRLVLNDLWLKAEKQKNAPQNNWDFRRWFMCLSVFWGPEIPEIRVVKCNSDPLAVKSTTSFSDTAETVRIFVASLKKILVYIVFKEVIDFHYES